MDISARTRILFLITAIGFGWIIFKKTAVHETELPFGSTDLTSVEHRLAKLEPEEARLVRAYVTRSNGDYMPMGGDPDNNFNARNFGDAIENQRAYEIRTAARVAQAEAEREARLRPLLDHVDATVVSMEITTAPERSGSTRGNMPAEVLRSRIRVANVGEDTIESLSGTLKAYYGAFLPITICWISHVPKPLGRWDSIEFDCVGRVDGATRAMMETPEESVRIEWEPQRLKLADGRELVGR